MTCRHSYYYLCPLKEQAVLSSVFWSLQSHYLFSTCPFDGLSEKCPQYLTLGPQWISAVRKGYGHGGTCL